MNVTVTTDSQTSEEDTIPPPLPIKSNRDTDHSSFIEESQYSTIKSVANPHYEILEIKNREVIFHTEKKLKSPPAPPPKPSRSSKGSQPT
jgi:hypothetical protein